jgi:hypothetical protein
MKYSEILNSIKDKNVELRHDVDISIESAYRMAKYENELSVKSIYYLRFDCDYYNLLTSKNIKILDYLMENHEIGCHVDCTNFENEDSLYNYLYNYNKIIPFRKFTFHINTDKTKRFGNIKYFQNKSILTGEYISDSKNNFDDDKLLKIKNLNDFTLVIHPEWLDNDNFSFCDDGLNGLVSSLRLDEMKRKALKEILNYE